jgi:VanZ family protein
MPGIAWFFIVLVLMCLPGEKLPQTGNFYDKWLHFGVFGFLVFLFCWPFYRSHFSRKERNNYFIKIALSAAVWGLIIELIQKFFVQGRSFDLLDWVADSIGALLGFFVSSYIFNKHDKTTSSLS